MSPNIPLTKHWDYRSRHHSVDELTVIGSAALVAPATAGSTNSARTITAHLLTYGEQPSSVVTPERRYGPRRLRDNDDDDDTVIGTLAIDGWTVTLGTARRGLGEKEGPGRAEAPLSPLLAVPNVTVHPSTASVPTSYYSMRQYNCLWILKC